MWDPFLRTGAVLFGAVARVRGHAYDEGWLGATKVDIPVISVGNVAVGGTGKTPFTILLAARLADRRVAVLSRGYRRRDTSEDLVVVDAETPVDACGDEPRLIANATDATVVVCADRVRGAKEAIARGAEVILLDDGFQHRRLARDVDLVLVDAKKPFGNGRLLPAGPLREPPAALRRATAIVVNHGDEVGPIDPALDAFSRIEVVVEATPSVAIEGKKVALLSGIARPERFESTVRRLGAEVVHVEALGDHAWFDRTVLTSFTRAASAASADVLLTTEKDRVRMAETASGFETVAIRHRIVAGEDVLVRTLADAAAGA